ncbi:MAG: TSUP family transporter, partial [Clostridia bacterium]
MTIIWFILAGLAGGILGGLGMGGGTLLIPILTLLLGVEQKLAQTINLVVFLPMATVAIIVNIKRHMIRFDKILFLLLPALATSVGS